MTTIARIIGTVLAVPMYIALGVLLVWGRR